MKKKVIATRKKKPVVKATKKKSITIPKGKSSRRYV